MARTRLVIDVITKDPLSDARQRAMVREASDFVHTIGIEPEDEVDESVEKNFHAHTHVSTRDENCSFCIENGCSDQLR